MEIKVDYDNTTIGFDPQFRPTNRLRWHRVKMTYISIRSLEQLWVNGNGEEKWMDIETFEEEDNGEKLVH